ncbi:Protein of unknown function [Desulfocicer vacuolatum DSM 3385]|uniref:DUF1329 domain-containing protein n=1 Tax=Desulfocicer vacuolatum DSM 3385 TaxID=1121400 RepID=A0A1W2D664_9BACT|nr:DUF1329 domain-containing protein [Desulfocicer vacuolatum]SMC92548.1 Protein of unknown function [Desulfocicer vacuolatum DSM 3385]
MNRMISVIVCIMLVLSLGIAHAKVSPEEAARLKVDLTPVGAERAGNADGTIPEWTGGLKNPPPHKKGEWLPDPFADEKPLFTITTENYKQHADKLSPSQIMMFEKKHPNWKMDIYPTHRVVKLPDWVEENTYNNALNAELVDNGNGVNGACGGIPFPIPQSGGEMVQNTLMRFWGDSMKFSNIGFSGYKNSPGVKTFGTEAILFLPYYQKQGTDCNDYLVYFSNLYTIPSRRKGERIVLKDALNASETPRQAWQYIPGQRRVRRAPTIGFDTPDMPITTYDDGYMYNGSPERYNWKILGKKEIYIPYNCYSLDSAYGRGVLDEKDVTPGYPESDLVMRWELHRTWVLEGTVKEDERHIYSKRLFFVDEDSWTIAIQDRFDAKGNLWRTSFGNTYFDYGGSKTTQSRPMIMMDYLSGEYTLWYLSIKPMEVLDSLPEGYFSPQGLRKRARR